MYTLVFIVAALTRSKFSLISPKEYHCNFRCWLMKFVLAVESVWLLSAPYEVLPRSDKLLLGAFRPISFSVRSEKSE